MFEYGQLTAISSSEYMGFDEIKEIIKQHNMKSNKSNGSKLGPPPSKPPPPPPKTPPAIQHRHHRSSVCFDSLPRPPKKVALYQNVPPIEDYENTDYHENSFFSMPMHVDCYSAAASHNQFRPILTNVDNNLLISANNISSCKYYQQSTTNSSDSSAATMIYKETSELEQFRYNSRLESNNISNTLITNDDHHAGACLPNISGTFIEDDLNEDDECCMDFNDLSPLPGINQNRNINNQHTAHVSIKNRHSLNINHDISGIIDTSKQRFSVPSCPSNGSSKSIASISPIMTSSRADLNQNRANSEKDLCYSSPQVKSKNFNFNSLPSRGPKPRISHSPEGFVNRNYYFVEGDELQESLSHQLSILLPPSPFKSQPAFHPIIITNDKPKKPSQTAKKVSFMINNEPKPINGLTHISPNFDSSDTSAHSSPSRSSSPLYSSSLSPSKHCLSTSPPNQLTEKELELIQEKIFHRIFPNEDYFSSKAAMPSSWCGSSSTSSTSSTSSSSSGYKSNHSSCLHTSNNNQASSASTLASPNSNQPPQAVELNYFIEHNKERLNRLKIKRNQLLISGAGSCNKLNELSSNPAESICSSSISSCATSSSSASSSSSSSSVCCNEENTSHSNAESIIFKNESAKLFQKILNRTKQSILSAQSPKVKQKV